MVGVQCKQSSLIEDEDITSTKQRLELGEEELLQGCEGVEGMELALCIVDRFATDLQMKEGQRRSRLKEIQDAKKAEHKKKKRKSTSGKSDQVLIRPQSEQNPPRIPTQAPISR
ncbi:hypothetical protein OESDEN_05945 [Oesophagostomum dentatum]|uniref:Uncharacterized protein n=1 Tax=Oesophagostomum dentatum TaxID=61180 RepID=A0A0B1TFK5_OESDE|nr:hypothetical protein OESDEN_05945 [Oesophagostomum dentatum]